LFYNPLLTIPCVRNFNIMVADSLFLTYGKTPDSLEDLV
jgi:hypothetical protein